MKKYFSISTFVAIMIAISSVFTSCGGDDDNNGGGDEVVNTDGQKVTSGLVGKWKVVSDVTITDFGKRLEHEPGAIWVFTDKTLTIYNEKDLYNKKSVEYTYRDSKIYTSGFPVRNVVELTNTTMVLTCKTFVDYDQTVTLQREE